MAPTPPPPPPLPYALMPLAAALGLYVVYAAVRTVWLIYCNAAADPDKVKRATALERLRNSSSSSSSTASAQPTPLQSKEFALLFLSLILSLIAYTFVVARVEAGYQRVEYQSFDPYALLGLTKPVATAATAEEQQQQQQQQPLEAAVVQEAFKKAVALHKAASSDDDKLEQLKLAYTALAEGSNSRARLNYERFGHPLGPLEVEAFVLAVPAWLRAPVGPYATILYSLYAAALVFVFYTAVTQYKAYRQEQNKQQKALTEEEQQKAAAELMDSSNSVSKEDLAFLIHHLTPDATHLEILWTICATPDNVAWSLRNVAAVEKVRQERREKDQEPQQHQQNKKKDDLAAMLDEGGWDDDDEDDEGSPAAAEQAKREKELQNMKQATGQTKVLLEGVDEGVLGQQWVEQTLAKHMQWPPKTVDMFKEIEYEGKKIEKVLDHPGLRRILCMTMGRLNSQMLNSHPELLQAGARKMIDQTYFRASMEFRQRVGLLLEGALRVSMMLRSFKLVSKIIETVALFRIGCQDHPKSLQWFQAMMQKSNGCLPSLQVHESRIVSIGYGETICADDVCECQLDLERTHAEQFTKAKVAMCQKQGIPPQAALQGYREGWWLLLRCERLDGATPEQKMNMEVLNELGISEKAKEIYSKEAPEEHLVSAIPLMVSSIAQKRGKFQLKFKAPADPGKYKFTLTIKSQDFLGADQNLTLTTDILDAAKVNRKKKEEDSDEPKKDK